MSRICVYAFSHGSGFPKGAAMFERNTHSGGQDAAQDHDDGRLREEERQVWDAWSSSLPRRHTPYSLLRSPCPPPLAPDVLRSYGAGLPLRSPHARCCGVYVPARAADDGADPRIQPDFGPTDSALRTATPGCGCPVCCRTFFLRRAAMALIDQLVLGYGQLALVPMLKRPADVVAALPRLSLDSKPQGRSAYPPPSMLARGRLRGNPAIARGRRSGARPPPQGGRAAPGSTRQHRAETQRIAPEAPAPRVSSRRAENNGPLAAAFNARPGIEPR